MPDLAASTREVTTCSIFSRLTADVLVIVVLMTITCRRTSSKSGIPLSSRAIGHEVRM